MASKDVLLVLVMGDAGLRSTLTARLAMTGAHVFTARGYDDAAAAAGRICLLVTDSAALEQLPGGTSALVQLAHWARIVLVVEKAPSPDETDARLVRVEQRDAVAAIGALVHELSEAD